MNTGWCWQSWLERRDWWRQRWELCVELLGRRPDQIDVDVVGVLLGCEDDKVVGSECRSCLGYYTLGPHHSHGRNSKVANTTAADASVEGVRDI